MHGLKNYNKKHLYNYFTQNCAQPYLKLCGTAKKGSGVLKYCSISNWLPAASSQIQVNLAQSQVKIITISGKAWI